MRLLATLGILSLILVGIGSAAHAHAAPAHRWIMYLAAHWNDDGTIEVAGTDFSRFSTVYVEVFDAETGDTVSSGDLHTSARGTFLGSTDYIGCYQNPYTGDFDDVRVKAEDLRTDTVVYTGSFDGCPTTY
jgi:hypothetical protein